ncbi:SDR family oxidoreductase [Flavobacterium psychrotrophum]|uniref:SDR family oxidoreductase n=1 Tax=Flavobacterium psychrotrophum TaxID=2294119 RepID=UPI000E3222E3|nr:SDR family NAD(P)-dependent oxidoreductase [Flavobacterium psychrotrophum]
MNLQGKTILITGGASGIGLEAARQFHGLGNKVIITGRNQAKLDAAKQLLPGIVAIQSDAAKAEDAQALFDQVKTLGGIDILYNNAGVGVPPLNLGNAHHSHVAGALYEMEVNYIGVIRLNNLFMEQLKKRPEAAIINTTSILSIVPSVLEATYSASKAALSSYTKTLRSHLKVLNSTVRVYELLPPLVDTDMVADRPDKKISPEKLVNALIKGMQNDQFTIRVGDTKIVSVLNRLLPNTVYGIINPKKAFDALR